MERIWGTIKNSVFALAVAAAGLGASADQVQLVNGDTLTGKVVAQTPQGVTLDHPQLGQLLINADRVAKVVLGSDLPAPEPKATPDQSAPAKPPKPKPKADPKQAVKKNAEQAAELQDPQTLAGFFEDWNSKLTIGLNGATGNTDRQNYYAKFVTKFEDGRHRWNVDARWFAAFADGAQTQNQFETNLTKDWLQEDSNWFFFVKGQYKYDANRSWENRTSAFGGGGLTLAKTDDVEVNTRLGFGGTYEFGDIDEFTPEALFGGSVIKWHVTERAALSGETIYYPSLQDTANFRVESKLEWTYKLDMAKGLSLKLGLENEYDSSTPNDSGNNDLKYYGALVVSF